MTTIIPARRGDGSRIDCLTAVGGRSLLHHTIEAAREIESTDIIVATADAAVVDAATVAGVEPMLCPEATMAAGVADEVVVRQVLTMLARADREVDIVVLLDCELPLRRPGRVAEACALLVREEADSLFTCTCEPPWFWRQSPGGLIPFYDPQCRLVGGESDEPAWLREDGSIYVFRSAGMRRADSRIFGRIARLRLDPVESLRVDSPEALQVCEALLPGRRAAVTTAG